jgi:lipopolysaccharide biosynthesis protein
VYYTSKIDDYKKMLENVSLRLETIKKELTDKKNVQDSMRRDSVKLVKNIPILKLKEELDTNKKDTIKTKTIMEFLEGN